MKPEQITAWALDEASPEERQQLEAALLENPQDKQKAEETKAFCDFLLSELRDDSLALTDQQREQLVEQSSRLPAESGTLAQQSEEQSSRLRSTNGPRTPQTKWRIGIMVRLAVAACVALGGFWTWQAYLQKQTEGHASAAVVVAEKPEIKVQLAQKPEAKKKAGQGPEARLLVEKQNKALVKMEPSAGKPPAPAPMPAAVAGVPALALKKNQSVMSPGDVEKLKRIQDQNAYALNFGEKMAAPAAEIPVVSTQKAEQSAAAAAAAASASVGGSGLLAGTGGMMQQGTGTLTLNGASAATLASTVDLTVVPSVTEFDGFINFGSSVVSPASTVQNGSMASVAGAALKDGAGVVTFGGVAAPAEMKALEVRGDLPMAGGANIVAGSGALVVNGHGSPPPSQGLLLDLGSGATVTTKSGTTATAPVNLATGASSLTVGQVVTATPLTRNAGANGVLGNTAIVTPMPKEDTGNLTLGAANTYAGSTLMNGGVTVNRGTAIHGGNLNAGDKTYGDVAASAPSAGTTFAFTTAATTGNVDAGASLTKSGAGTLTLAGGGTIYTGTTTISGGTVTLADDSAQSRHSGMLGGGIAGAAAPAQASRELNSMNGTALAPAAALQPMPGQTAGGAGWAVEYDQLSVASSTSTGSTVVLQKPQSVTAAVGATIAAVVPATPAIPGAAGGAAAPAAPEEKPVALSVSPGSDTRYLAIDEISSIATKDMAKKLEVTAFRKSDPTSGESYTRIIENEMKDVAREPLSTLSIDVDTASYANVRRFLNQNMIPPPDAVRIEELVNYFPTSEEGPAHEAKEPFAVRVELAPCPWQPVHRLARISIKGREMDKNRKASNLVFLVDVSGSMNEPAKLPLVQQSLRMLTQQLGEGDHVTMVVYAGSSGVVLPPTNGEKKAEILAAIDRLSAGGSTHGSAGIKLAYEQAVAGFIKGGVNRVILCTDGDFNVGVSSPEELEKLIKHKAKTGVFLSVLGFGSGNLQDRTMETLADKGNGNYAYIDSLSEARKVLVEQMGSTLDTIAKDVKIQVEFNPAAVRSYRLIGYENRLLAKEDFNDDTKDAGEIGAGHSVVALYEIVPTNLPPGAEGRPAVDSLKYQAPAITPAQLAEAAKSGETMTVKLRYKAPDSDLSKLIEVPTKDAGKTLTASSEEFKFSAAVAGFGLLLRDSAYKGTLSWETVRRLALDGKGTDKLGYRGEFLQLIDKARGLKETR
jgi:autotransporter-associated beta strand protein